MRSPAIRERAQRRLATLREAAARVRARDLMMVLWRVAAVLLGLQLAYLAIGNLVLRSQLVQHAVNSSDGFVLEFGSAYTLWPGHAVVRDLSLRVEDYNVEFEVALAKANVDIALSELPFKKFHVTRLDAQGTRFRMRHKLIAVGADAERVAGYPKIKGFADPPYFSGVRPPPISDAAADHDLWKIRVENVQAAISELWVMEYRYSGPGQARGSFVVHPTRWVQVQPASLWLEGGALTLGEHLVAGRVTGKISCDIPDMKVQAREGPDVLKDISAGVRLELKAGKLDFLRAYLARLGSARYGGNAEFSLNLKVTRGVLQPASRVDVRATPFELHHEFADLKGDLMLTFQRESEPRLLLALSAPRLVASRKRAGPPPYLEGVVGSLELDGADLAGDLALGAARVAVARAHADSLSWLAPPGTRLAGAADASFELSRSATRELTGAARLSVERGELGHADLAFAGDLESAVSFVRGAEPRAGFEVGKLRVQLASASLRSGAKRSKSFNALVEGANLRLSSTGERATGRLRARISDAEALLPLVLGAPLRGITSTALNLRQLDAETSVQVSGDGVRLKLIDARSGNLRARGYFEREGREPRGAFLLSTGPINVGVTLLGDETEVSPFVADGWLATTWPRISRGDPGSG